MGEHFRPEDKFRRTAQRSQTTELRRKFDLISLHVHDHEYLLLSRLE